MARKVKNGQKKEPKMVINGQKWSKMVYRVKNGQKKIKMTKKTKMIKRAKNGIKQSKVAKKIAKNSQKR